ncbi:hypothetical protein C0J52_04788 [Blattella germanica]|nr:hypothetical protein C0J52_04788 [Blattella germanica]
MLVVVVCSANDGGSCPLECVCKDRTVCHGVTASTFDHLPPFTSVLEIQNSTPGVLQIDTVKLPLLTDLSLIDCHLSDLEAVSGLHTLLRLNLSSNLLSVLSTGEVGAMGGLEVLDVSCNNITHVEETVFTSLPALRRLNLSGNKLSEVVAGLNASLLHLDLSYNCISVLNDSTFSVLENLLELNLCGNGLFNVSSESFNGLANLQFLDLSQNQISTLESGTFSELTGLLKLNLSGNLLESLTEQCFRGLARLQLLDASHNRITSVSPGTFQPVAGLTDLFLADNPVLGLTVLVGTGRKLQTVDASRAGLVQVPAALTRSIRTLRLAGNVMTTVRCGDLDSYPLLRLLDLSDNRILELEEDALGRLEVLTTLYLSGNMLRTVPRSLPAGLTALHLQRNHIQQVSMGELQGLPRLKYLSLRDSGVTVIQNGALSLLPSLETLDLSHNPLTRLPGNALSGPIMTVLRLTSLERIAASNATEMSFPVTSPERLEVLELDSSPALARQLLADTAALVAFRQLRELDLGHAGLTSLRSDLFHYLPRLRVLRLTGNPWNCDDMLWLADWVRFQQQELEASLKDAICASPMHLASTPITDLRDEDFNITTTIRYDDTTISNFQYDSSSSVTSTSVDSDEVNTTSLFDEEFSLVTDTIFVDTDLVNFTSTEASANVTYDDILLTSISTTNLNQSERMLSSKLNFVHANTISNNSDEVEHLSRLPEQSELPKSTNTTKLYINTPLYTNKTWTQHKFFPNVKNRDFPPTIEPIQKTSHASNNLYKLLSKKNDTIFKKQTSSVKDLQKLIHQQEKSFNNIMQGDESLVEDEENIKDFFNYKDKFSHNKTVGKLIANFTEKPHLIMANKYPTNLSNNHTYTNLSSSTQVQNFHNYTNKTFPVSLDKIIRDNATNSGNETESSASLEGENLVFENVTLAVGDKSVFYSSRASDAYASGVRVTVKENVETSLFSGSHPGMFVLLGVGLAMAGALAIAMSHCAKRRRRQAVEYSRQQDIEVRSMSSIGDLW